MRNEVKFTLPYFFHFFKFTQRERERERGLGKKISINKKKTNMSFLASVK